MDIFLPTQDFEKNDNEWSLVGHANPAPATEMPTAQMYGFFQRAFDFYNSRLFAGSQPSAIIVLSRKARVRGHFSPARFCELTNKYTSDEIALNPDYFEGDMARPLETLVHEMVHQRLFHLFGAKKNGYHGKNFAETMKPLGLYPSNTSMPGGKETGQKMSQYVVEGGPFDLLTKEFLASEQMTYWENNNDPPMLVRTNKTPEKKAAKKETLKRQFDDSDDDDTYGEDCVTYIRALDDDDEDGLGYELITEGSNRFTRLDYIEPPQRGQTLAPKQGSDQHAPQQKKWRYEENEIDRALKRHHGLVIGIYEAKMVWIAYREPFSVTTLKEIVSKDNPPRYAMAEYQGEIRPNETALLTDLEPVDYEAILYAEIVGREHLQIEGKDTGRLNYLCGCKQKLQAKPGLQAVCPLCNTGFKAEIENVDAVNAYGINRRQCSNEPDIDWS